MIARNSRRGRATTARRQRISTRRRPAAGEERESSGRRRGRPANASGAHRASARTSARLSARTAEGAPPTDYKFVGMVSGGIVAVGLLFVLLIAATGKGCREEAAIPIVPVPIVRDVPRADPRSMSYEECRRFVAQLERDLTRLEEMERKDPGCAGRTIREYNVKLRAAREALYLHERRRDRGRP